jgi:hypothetical protein
MTARQFEALVNRTRALAADEGADQAIAQVLAEARTRYTNQAQYVALVRMLDRAVQAPGPDLVEQRIPTSMLTAAQLKSQAGKLKRISAKLARVAPLLPPTAPTPLVFTFALSSRSDTRRSPGVVSTRTPSPPTRELDELEARTVELPPLGVRLIKRQVPTPAEARIIKAGLQPFDEPLASVPVVTHAKAAPSAYALALAATINARRL